MPDDDSDVSAITITDDDEPKQKLPNKPPYKQAGGAGGNTGVSSGVGGGKPAGKSDRPKRRVAFQNELKDGKDGEIDVSGDKRLENRSEEADGDDGNGAVQDETKPLGWSYFRKRDVSEGPETWNEVDVDELRFVAENLVRSTTKRATQADDVMQQIFQPAPGDEDSLVPDPLGRGVIDPVTLTMGKRSKMQAALLTQPTTGDKGLKATMRKFRTARLNQQQQQQQGGAEGPGGSGQQAAAKPGGSVLDEETRKVLPNQEGFEPEAYLAAFHSESSTGQLEKGLRALSRELSERTGQLKQLIRNNFDRFINCKDAIDDIHAKMCKTLVRAAVAPPSAAASVSGSSALSPPSQLQLQQQQQPVATERVFRSLEQVQVQARRTFGPILDRAAKADRIRAVSSLLQRFDHLFAAPQRVIELAARGELEQVVREYKRANMLIRPTHTTARVWISLYTEIEKRVTEVYLAVKQLVTDPSLEIPPMGQDGPEMLAAIAATSSNGSSDAAATSTAANGMAAGFSTPGDDTARQRLSLLPDYLLFLVLMRQERLPAAREEDPMRLYVSRMETLIATRIQACDKHHTEQTGQLVTAWMRATNGIGGGGGSSSTTAAAALRSAASSVSSLQASLTPLPPLDSPAAVAAAVGTEERGSKGVTSMAARGQAGADGGAGDVASDVDDLDDEAEAAESSFLQWRGEGLAAVPSAVFLGSNTASLPYHIRIELRRLVQEPGRPYGGGGGGGDDAANLPALSGTVSKDGVVDLLPYSVFAPEPHLTVAQRQWVSYVCSISSLLFWSVPGLWATCSSPKYGNNADLNDESREGLERGMALAARLVQSLCTKYGTRFRRALQSLTRAGPLQPCVPLIIKDACLLWRCLQGVGVAARTLVPLRSAVMAALGSHVRVLADHLGALPQLLFGADDFCLDLLAADHQPVTCLPRRLEEEVGVALLHYQWPLMAVFEAAGGAGEVPAEAGWRPMQAAVFACFSVLMEALAEYAMSLSGDEAGKDGRSSSLRSKITSALSVGDSVSGSVVSSAAGQAAAAAQHPVSSHRGIVAAVGEVARRGGQPSDAARRDLNTATGSGGGFLRRATDVSEVDGDDGPTRGSPWSGSGSNDVRVLLVISNSAVIRTRVVPGVVERHRRLLAPTAEGASTCQRRLREMTSAMRRSNEALGSTYLGRKEADVKAQVQRYLAAAATDLTAAATAPSLPPGAAGAGSQVGARATAADGASASKHRTTAEKPGRVPLPGPSGPSPGCCSLLQLLTTIHNEALAYSPSNLRSFMEALAERLVGEMALGCRGLCKAAVAAATSAGGGKRVAGTSGIGSRGGGGGASIEQLVQLMADMQFLMEALRPLLTDSLMAQLHRAQEDVGTAMVARQRAHRYRPASVAAAVVADLEDGAAVSDALEELLAPNVDTWLQLHALNVRCFAVGAATTAGAARAAGAAASGT